eukprot:g7998.t1
MNQTRGQTTSSSSRHPGGGTLKGHTLPRDRQPVLDKQQVLQLRKYQRGLKDLEDERTNGLMVQIESMKEAFLLLKKKREWLAKLYKERREDVLRQLAEMREEIEVTFARLHKELKDFAADWMATKADAVQEWEDTLEERSQEIEASFREIRAKNAEVDAGIQREREERTVEIDEAAAGVRHRLSEIRANLKATTEERLENEAAYEKNFEDNFARLHRILGRETETREQQCVVDVEEAEREAAQAEIVRDAQSFLDQFRDNLEGDIVKIRDRNQIRLGFIELDYGKE